MSQVKYETISFRLTKEDADLIRSYAENERISVSALVRSSMIRLIKKGYSSETTGFSPAPNFDKLGFEVRVALLRQLEFVVSYKLAQGMDIQEIEKWLLFEDYKYSKNIPDNLQEFSELIRSDSLMLQ